MFSTMKKESLLKEFALRILRVLIVIYLGSLLYPYLTNFIEENDTYFDLCILFSSIIIYIITIITTTLYSYIRTFLWGDFDDENDITPILIRQSLIIFLFVLLAIKSHNSFGTKFTILFFLGIELFGFLHSVYDIYFKSDEEDETIEIIESE
ncbi:hypothetical protein [uncultured Tenacibaculum sp.]|uniref:hypothetical protein n=1 Tax=uncultured Tenacibaculum sp. TaxID=174713 RepID=UPI002606358E|nr:hypothetical protein [uncultured Tenacibaculum sp.]